MDSSSNQIGINSGNESSTEKQIKALSDIKINIENTAPGTNTTISNEKSDLVDLGGEKSKSRDNWSETFENLSTKGQKAIQKQAREEFRLENLNELSPNKFNELLGESGDYDKPL